MEMVPLKTTLNLSDLGSDPFARILVHLSTADIAAIRGTSNIRLMQYVQDFNNHMLTKYQVALWNIQSKINFFDANVFNKIAWPPHIRDLGVFNNPMFTQQANFVRHLIQVYCPLASLFKIAPPLKANCNEHIKRMCSISENELSPANIVEFVNIAFAAMEDFKMLTVVEATQQTINFEKLYYHVHRVTQKQYPTLIDYMEGLDNMRYDDVHQWNEGPKAHPIDFVRQVLTRTRIFDLVMQNVQTLSLDCMPQKTITYAALNKLPQILQLEIVLNGDPNGLRTVLIHLARANQIKDLCVSGYRCHPNVAIGATTFHPFRRLTSLKRLMFRYCDFINDQSLHWLAFSVINVTNFGSLYNSHITAQGMIRSLRAQRKIQNVEVNQVMVDIVHEDQKTFCSKHLFDCCLYAFSVFSICCMIFLLFYDFPTK